MARDKETAPQETDWLAVAARSLSFLCLHYAEMRDKTLLDQAAFLGRFGISRKEAAALLGTSDGSLAALGRQKQQKTGGQRGAAQAKRAAS